MREFKLNEFETLDFELCIMQGITRDAWEFHMHEFTELTIITSGTADHVVDNGKGELIIQPIKEMCICRILPTQQHKYINVQDMEHYNFIFDLQRITNMFPNLYRHIGFSTFFLLYSTSGIFQVTKEQFQQIKYLCEQISFQFFVKPNGYNIVTKCYFICLLVEISNAYHAQHYGTNIIYEKIASAIEYIDTHYQEKITIQEIADILHYSSRHLLRLFYKTYGISCQQYLIDCRLNHACQLLQKNGPTVSEVAKQCGYNDPDSFYRVFKKKFNITPNEYRISQQK